MKRLLTTTFLVTALSVSGAFAQAAAPAAPDAATSGTTGGTTMTMPAVKAPEGFTRENVRLTADQLLGATLYDSAGKSIGEVHDLVFAMGDSTTTTGSIGKTGTSSMPSDATSNPPSAMDSTAGTSGSAMNDTTGSSGTGTSGTGTTDTTGSTGSGTGMAAGTDSSGSTGASAASPGAATGTEMAPSMGANDTTGSVASGNTDDTTGSITSTTGEVTHAVLDIGGFLGIGQHRVAVPVTDLAVYRNASETRVYLPWTQAQLKALPTYEENDPSTLGRPLGSSN